MEDRATQRPVQRAVSRDKLLPDGSLVLYRDDRRAMLVLNPLAALIWESCTGERTVAAIVREIRSYFPDQESVDRDVLACIHDLVAKGFIAFPDPPARDE